MKWLHRRLLEPLLALLRGGLAPRQLALCVAIAIVVGNIPILGVSTILCTFIALIFRLNLPAMQLIQAAMAPTQLLLIIPFVRLGEWMLRAPRQALSVGAGLALLSKGVWQAIVVLRDAIIHAAFAWILIAPFCIFLLHRLLTPVFVRMAAQTKFMNTAAVPMPMSWSMRLLERDLLPDFLVRFGIRRLLAARLKEENQGTPEAQQQHLMKLIERLRQSPIAINTGDANQQHYELPSAFFERVLGRHLKYSSGYYREPDDSLDQAEANMLELTAQRARLQDGERILELGCGWGSLTLWMAERFPQSHITAVSNSRTQKRFIDARADAAGLKNLNVVTSDMNNLSFPEGTRFDRAVSVEMFEHMRNYEVLMQRISGWLEPQGTLFVHIFTHKSYAYPFEVRDATDWMAKYFFTGGIMPSDDLLLYFQKDLTLCEHWQVDGRNYSRTAEHWLQNMDDNRKWIEPVFAETYGQDQVRRWWVYWRVFFMSCAELWGYAKGQEWLVSHYLFTKERRDYI